MIAAMSTLPSPACSRAPGALAPGSVGANPGRPAEIRGRFEGTLTVRKRLFIRATGRVMGTIRYGQIEVERGGRISGDIEATPETASSTEAGPSRVA